MVTPTTIAHCWEKCVGKDDNTEDETKLIPFPKQEVKAACNALAWIEVDAEALVTQHLSEKDIAASVKNGNTTDKPGIIDSGSDPESNSDGCCEVVVPKYRKMVENINKVMT
jgi:hypothetical protein